MPPHSPETAPTGPKREADAEFKPQHKGLAMEGALPGSGFSSSVAGSR